MTAANDDRRGALDDHPGVGEAPTGRIVYLHGFRSSPRSFKARMLGERLARAGVAHRFDCPRLPISPAAAIALLQQRHMLGPQDTLIGSSLGGYYATWLAEHSGCRAVLLNPAVFPARDLAPYVGEVRGWHDDEPMAFTADHLAELRALECQALTRPQRYFLIAAKGDEVIDWRDMTARYPGVPTLLLERSDHALSDFADHIDPVLAFAGVPTAGSS